MIPVLEGSSPSGHPKGQGRLAKDTHAASACSRDRRQQLIAQLSATSRSLTRSVCLFRHHSDRKDKHLLDLGAYMVIFPTRPTG